MIPEDIRDRLRERPFEPFQMRLSNGSSYAVPHPELLLVGRRKLVIGLPRRAGGLPVTFANVDPFHVVELLPIDSAEAS